MKKKISFITILIIILAKFNFVEAKIFIGDKIDIYKPTSDEIFIIGDEIYIKNILQKEFIGVARKIIADTEIYKDFIGVGIKVEFNGKAKQDIILIGNNIKATGVNEGNITSFGKNIQIKMFVENNLKASAENIEIEGKVNGKTTLWGKDIFVRGEFEDLVIYGNNIVFEPDTIIKGNLTYNTPEKKDLSSLNVKGNINWNKPFSERIKEKTPIEKLKKLYLFFSLLFPVLTTFFFFPNLFKQTTYISGRKIIQCFISGSLLIISVLIALPVIFITIIGAPLGLIITAMFLSTIYVSRVFLSIYVSRILFFKMKDTNLIWVISIFIGIFLFTTISLHPPAKIILNIISIPTGFGALLKGRISFMKKLKREGVL